MAVPTTSLSGPRVSVSLSGALSLNGALGLISTNGAPNLTSAYSPQIGNAGVQVNALYSARRVVVNSGTPLDLDFLSIVDILGATLTFDRIYAIMIQAVSTTVGEILTVGGASSNPLFGATAIFPPLTPDIASAGPGVLCYVNEQGITVAAGTRTLRVATAAGTNVNFDVIVLGRAN